MSFRYAYLYKLQSFRHEPAQLDLYHTTEHPESTAVAEETIQMVTELNERLSKFVRTLLDMSELQTVSRNYRIELHSLIEEVLHFP